MFYQILALLIWSSSFVVAKYAYTMLTPALLVQIRLLIAALIVLPSALRYWERVPENAWNKLLLLAFLHYVAVLLLQFIGLSHTSAASAVTLLGLEPLLVAFVGHFFFHDRAQWYHWLFGILAFLGVVLLVVGDTAAAGKMSLLGSFLVLSGSVVFCFLLRPTQRLIGQIGAPVYTSLSLLLGAILCLPFSLVLAHNSTIHWSWHGGVSVLYLGVACSWLAYVLWNKGMSSVSANLSGLLTSLEPAFGVLLAVVFLGETLSAISWLGVFLILFATLCASVLPHFLVRRRTI